MYHLKNNYNSSPDVLQRHKYKCTVGMLKHFDIFNMTLSHTMSSVTHKPKSSDCVLL